MARGTVTQLGNAVRPSGMVQSVDELTRKLARIHASLALIVGEGAESFDSLSPSLRDSYLWGLQTDAQECLELVGEISNPSNGRAA